MSPLSPELALVDPELAAAARAALSDRPWETFVALPVEIVDLEAARTPAPRAFRRLTSIAVALLAASAVALLTAATPDGGIDVRRPEARAAAPRVTSPALPARSSQAQPVAQTFSWMPAPNASAYEFQLFRGAERVFRARVKQPRLEVPLHTLERGSYVWYVWSVSGRTSLKATAASVRARLVVG